MYLREWVCRKCNQHYPCRKVFVSNDGIWAVMPEEEAKRCLSPFRAADFVHAAEFVEVERK